MGIVNAETLRDCAKKVKALLAGRQSNAHTWVALDTRGGLTYYHEALYGNTFPPQGTDWDDAIAWAKIEASDVEDASIEEVEALIEEQLNEAD